MYANGSPIDRGGRSSVLVCDWNNDNKKDLVFADQGSPGFYWFRNVGSDSSPVLSAAQSIWFGGQLVNYVRPNLGSYVDWDGDGKRDFIGCHFENNIRLYRNTGSGQPGVAPQFANPEGVMIVQPWNIMMTSGADALDFNADGDLDILTGQGHGGGGLRFYDRDFINDFVNNTYPIVEVGENEVRFVRADLDKDGDVDQGDFGYMQACLSGSWILPESGCEHADLDLDRDVDRDDSVILQACISGTGVPADPECGNR